MADLILKFADERGAPREVNVTTDRFSIGRTPDNDLMIASGALSRKHAEITRFGDIFIIADNNSSNGTTLNGKELKQPVALKNADQIVLGGAIEMQIKLSGSIALNSSSLAEENSTTAENSWSGGAAESTAFWQSTYFIAPVFGVVALLLVVVMFFVLNNEREKPAVAAVEHESQPDEPEEGNRRLSRKQISTENDNDDDEPSVNRQTTENTGEKSNSELTNANLIASNVSSEDEKVENVALQFLRQISDNQKPVLSSKQVALINAKIKLLKTSAAFRDNLKTASKNVASFEKIGQSHNLKGAFLIAAALAKIGDARGSGSSDVAATAEAMAPDLQKYTLVLGTELANDNLLAIAAFAEGNPPNAMRDRVANLTLMPGSTAATVRTIWFLHDNGKLSDGAFDFAVRFIAAGTLLQNPAAFNL